jgi:uncharacterized membrane-anchored protein
MDVTTSQRKMLSKVPPVTLSFWFIKIMATTVGETAADLLNVNLHLGLSKTSYLMGALLVVALAAQLHERRYVPWIYWLSVVLISVVGTLLTDNLTDGVGVPLQLSTGVFAVALAATFAAWYGSEKTLSIHSIVTRRREQFYWAAILFTFALGTAAGDLVAEALQLGYLVSALIFGAGIGAVTAGYYYFNLPAIPAFWLAYILTRPLGASIGDLLSQPTQSGGLGLGTVATSAMFLAVIGGLIGRMTVLRRRRRDARGALSCRPDGPCR